MATMDGKTIKQLRDALEERIQRLEKNAGQRDAHRDEAALANDGGAGQAEIIDMAQMLEQLGRDTSLAEQERRELKAIERALKKMQNGTFGICEDCGDAIPPRRLMVLPQARLCANCQAFEERQASRVRFG